MEKREIQEALEKSNVMNMDSLFKAVPLNDEGTKFVIVFGNTIASTTIYETKKQALKAIESKDWNLIATMICQICSHMLANEKKVNSKTE